MHYAALQASAENTRRYIEEYSSATRHLLVSLSAQGEFLCPFSFSSLTRLFSPLARRIRSFFTQPKVLDDRCQAEFLEAKFKAIVSSSSFLACRSLLTQVAGRSFMVPVGLDNLTESSELHLQVWLSSPASEPRSTQSDSTLLSYHFTFL